MPLLQHSSPCSIPRSESLAKSGRQPDAARDERAPEGRARGASRHSSHAPAHARTTQPAPGGGGTGMATVHCSGSCWVH